MHRLEVKSELTVVGDDGTITGLAWPFGSVDSVGDVITKGAFAGAKAPLPMFAEHDPNQNVGVWDSIDVTARGLELKGRLLIDQVARAREVFSLIKAGSISGLSIGFSNTKSTPRAPRGRNISALTLREISVVAVPCNSGARIESAKSLTAISIADTINRATAHYRKK